MGKKRKLWEMTMNNAEEKDFATAGLVVYIWFDILFTALLATLALPTALILSFFVDIGGGGE